MRSASTLTGDQLPGKGAVRVVDLPQSAVDRRALVDQLGRPREADIGIAGFVLKGERDMPGIADFRGFSGQAPGQKPARPPIFAGFIGKGFDHTRMGIAVLGRCYDPAIGHLRNRRPCRMTASARPPPPRRYQVDEASERRQLAGRSMIGQRPEIHQPDVWHNIGENLSRQPQKASALDLLQQMAETPQQQQRSVRQGAARV